MDTMNITKIVAGGCAALLAFMVFGIISHSFVSSHAPEKPAYSVEVAGADTGAAEEVVEVSIADIIAMGDIAKGEKVAKKCLSCHVFDEGGATKTGPALWGIMGKDIAATEGYAYSKALLGLEGGWSWEAMNGFLTKPKAYAKGTKMGFAGLKKPADRASIMLWMNAKSGAPIAQP